MSGTPQQPGVSMLTPPFYPLHPPGGPGDTPHANKMLFVANLKTNRRLEAVTEVNSAQLVRAADTHVRRVSVSVYNHTSPVSSLAYSCSDLYRLRRGNGYPSTSFIMRLKYINLFHVFTRKEDHDVSRLKSFLPQEDCTDLLPSSFINSFKFLFCGFNPQRGKYQMSRLCQDG